MINFEENILVGDVCSVDEFIAKYCTKFDVTTGAYKGFTLIGHDYVELDIPPLFEEKLEWRDHGYRRIWVSEVELAKIEFVEGDIYVTVYDSEEEFKQAMEGDDIFYRVY